jgi:hypothetical protein
MLLSQPKCGPSLHYFPSVAVRTLRACQCLVWGAVGVFFWGGVYGSKVGGLGSDLAYNYHLSILSCLAAIERVLVSVTALCAAHLAVAVAISQLATALCAAIPHLAMAGANSAVSTQAICVQCWLRVHVGTAWCCIPGCVHGAATARCSLCRCPVQHSHLHLAPNIVPIAQASTVQWKLVGSSGFAGAGSSYTTLSCVVSAAGTMCVCVDCCVLH